MSELRNPADISPPQSTHDGIHTCSKGCKNPGCNRQAVALFIVQTILFSVLCVNFRAIASAHYHTAAASDFVIASLQFFVIKKIADSDDSVKHWVGYTLGSVVGSYLGIYISTLITA